MYNAFHYRQAVACAVRCPRYENVFHFVCGDRAERPAGHRLRLHPLARAGAGPVHDRAAERRILGTRGSDGRVHVPPLEYDPVTHAPLTDLVEVSTVGTVLTWTWLPGRWTASR